MTHVSPGMQRVAALARAGELTAALDHLHELGEASDPEALATLGDIYWHGRSVARDPVAGRDFFRRASEADHPRGRAIFTNLLAAGLAGERDWPGALGRLADEARSDPARARAQALLNAMDLDGEGEPRIRSDGRILSDRLPMVIHEGLLTPLECAHVAAVAEPHFQRSTVLDDAGRVAPHPIRSSDTAQLHGLLEDPALHAINRRIAVASGTTYWHAEPMAVLRYQPGQQYTPHLDTLPGLENQRVRTALAYLNDDYRGGETVFPRLDLKVKGRAGDLLVFANTDGDRRPHPLSLHAGLPVTTGVKLLGSRRIRARRHAP